MTSCPGRSWFRLGRPYAECGYCGIQVSSELYNQAIKKHGPHSKFDRWEAFSESLHVMHMLGQGGYDG